jgi:hypothetical protein
MYNLGGVAERAGAGMRAYDGTWGRMAEPKTKPTKVSVDAFLNALPNDETRADCRAIAGLMGRATSADAEMWGPSIIGFGRRTLTYANGKEREMMLVAFSPRKQAITLYLGEFEGRQALLDKLGTHSCGKGCVYIKRLSDVDLPTLEQLVKAAAKNSART